MGVRHASLSVTLLDLLGGGWESPGGGANVDVALAGGLRLSSSLGLLSSLTLAQGNPQTVWPTYEVALPGWVALAGVSASGADLLPRPCGDLWV